ncbi:hypothetical protein YK48G_17950 [Lentilactobacillus fungorum]|uniref:DUF1659 domain-containing protein n=1 Tax=Lentilactobacillus fungorum TaxID=2201250 RepID=A0ABQ3W0L6_9LACO|nr:hypothetical protein [Lentilactobacillus fungorum]GHP14370.1 hypothetical protein YK48G_17950 [Lentilactobacillus fungorum]
MLNEQKLAIIVKTFAHYRVDIQTNKMTLTKINGQPVNFDATKYMQDQLINLICKVLANQLVAEVWQNEQAALGD